MHNLLRMALNLILFTSIFGLCTSSSSAEEVKLEQIMKKFDSFGMDRQTFRRNFGKVFEPGPELATTSQTPEELAAQVSEIRLFLTAEPNVVIGEIATVGKTHLLELPVSLEKDSVRFVNTGKSPDRKRGDGVFSAQFKMDTSAAFKTLRQELSASIDALRGQSKSKFVRRGPRDIVPVMEAVEHLKADFPKPFAALEENVDRSSKLLAFSDPLAAAKALNIDIGRTPFIVIPGPQFDQSTRLRFNHLFDFPIIPAFPLPSPPVAIDEFRSLMVVQPGVVEDSTRTFDACTASGSAGSAWSFGHLMRELSHGTGTSPEDFALQWLSTWQMAQEANGWIVNEPSRGAQLQQRVIDSWQRLSPGGLLNVDFFPARLLAIVNRPDLADKIGYGTAGSAGEGRLVFGLLEKPTAAGSCNNLPFTVIFEFGIKGGSCLAVKAWHQRWKDLDVHPLGSPAYNSALELITRDFTDHGSNPSQLPNMSSLNQLRTNEIALGSVWQLREFRLQSVGSSVPAGLLDLVTVKQTPDDSLNNTLTLDAFMTANKMDILADRHVVPGRFPGVLDRFLGAKSDAPFGFFWTAPSVSSVSSPTDAETRRKFSLATCNACHTGETNTVFTHIGSGGTRSPGSPAALSGFLTGITVPVPVTGGTHVYNDLAERENAMANILTQSCFRLLGVRRPPFVH